MAAAREPLCCSPSSLPKSITASSSPSARPIPTFLPLPNPARPRGPLPPSFPIHQARALRSSPTSVFSSLVQPRVPAGRSRRSSASPTLPLPTPTSSSSTSSSPPRPSTSTTSLPDPVPIRARPASTTLSIPILASVLSDRQYRSPLSRPSSSLGQPLPLQSAAQITAPPQPQIRSRFRAPHACTSAREQLAPPPFIEDEQHPRAESRVNSEPSRAESIPNRTEPSRAEPSRRRIVRTLQGL